MKSTGVNARHLEIFFKLMTSGNVGEAADKLSRGEPVHLSELAHALGYFDQAHFTRDFRKLVGRAPAQYRRGADQGG